MSDEDRYEPGPAMGARVDKDGGAWTLVLVRDLRHPPTKVWQALTDPVHLREWAPFDPDRPLSRVGPVQLTTVGARAPNVNEARVTRADAPTLLEYTWGDANLRWQLEPLEDGTRLTLWHNINRGYIAMGAAGWHICFDVLERWLRGQPIGRMVGMAVLKFGGWQRLHREYAEQFGVETPQKSDHEQP